MGLRAIILLLDNSLSEFILNPGLAPESKEGVRSDDLHPKFQMASKWVPNESRPGIEGIEASNCDTNEFPMHPRLPQMSPVPV